MISLHSICSPESGRGKLNLQDTAQAAASQNYVRKLLFFLHAWSSKSNLTTNVVETTEVIS